MDRNVVMIHPNGTHDSDERGSDPPVVTVAADPRVVDDRRRYTTQLQRRAQAHVTAELSVDSTSSDVDRQIAMLLQHAMERTGAHRVTLFRPVPKGQRWHAATVLEGGGFYYGLIAPDSLVLPMSAFNQKRVLILSADRPPEPLVPRPADLGFTNYLGVPVVSNDVVVAVIEAIDVNQTDDLDHLASELEQAVNALAEALAEEGRRHGWSPNASPARGLNETTVLDLVLRPSIDQDDTFEVSPQEWLLLNQLDGELNLGDVATNAGIQFGVAATVAASLLERGLIRVGKESRRRG
jgi:hypothetical protein